ncbi:MSMEG_4193 family putative phosphomutase [Janibacter sp. YIM B02568]|uniref:MSMEG_4193 family putative phosphomutase n=1 Tax=Janibacter endophyticus TaxID=2806261 RepID=UPI00195277F4|nr:MSMEG_4193 family putative phosphomutase [Janibacter endophyticus]MBM6546408.1 MSMEG_4193 family putative phosphomutase [Janibacter endophyticus]
MAYCVLLRHARSSANSAGVLAGWAEGVSLDDSGREQSAAVADRLADLPFVRIVSSPLPRCLETVAPLADRLGVDVEQSDDLGEARYGAWTGRPLAELAKEPLWETVQRTPSRAVFPASDEHEHESIAEMAQRAVAAVRRIDAEVEAEHGAHAMWLAVSHGDIIKSVVADAAATPLDDFQRIVIDPASVSLVRYTQDRPFVMRLNDTGTLRAVPAPDPQTPDGDAVVGGGAG